MVAKAVVLVVIVAATAAAAPRSAELPLKLAYSVSSGDGASSRQWLLVTELPGRTVAFTTPTRGRRDMNPVWSPDGRQLAFVRMVGRRADLFVARPPARPRLVVRLPRRSAAFAEWTPRSDRVVLNPWGETECTVQRPFRHRFSVVDVTRSRTRVIHALPAPTRLVGLGAPHVSPDGTSLLYLAYHGDNANGDGCRFRRPSTDIYTMSLSGASRRRVGGGELTLVRWSPDARRIAYIDCSQAEVEIACDLYVMSRDGTGKRRVSEGDISPSSDLEWTPDGRELLVTSSDGLWAESADGSGEREVAGWEENESSGSLLGFSRDGREIAVALYTGFLLDDMKVLVLPVSGGEGRLLPVPPPPRGSEIAFDHSAFIP